MKIKLLLLSILHFLVFITFSQKNKFQKETFIIKGEIVDYYKRFIYLSYQNESGRMITDSAEVKNNKFQFEGYIQRTTKIYLTNYSPHKGLNKNDKNMVCLYIEPQLITLNISNSDFNDIIINKEKTKGELKFIEDKKKRITALRDTIYKELNQLHFQIDSTDGTLELKNEYVQKINLLNLKIDSLNEREVDIDLSFITANKYSFATLDLLYSRIYNKPEKPSIDSIEKLFNSLSLMVRESPEGKKTEEIIKLVLSNAIGMKIKYFKLKDINNQDIDTDIFSKYNYTLIDFWASWCIPCRNEFPKMKKMYNEFKDKGFMIIGISRDKEIQGFLNAIQKDGTNIWINGLMTNEMWKIFHVPAIPLKFLVDKDGMIIGRWRGGGDTIDSIEMILKNNL